MNLGTKRNQVSQKFVGDLARLEIGSFEQRRMGLKDILNDLMDPFSLGVLQLAFGDFCLLNSSYRILQVGQALLKCSPPSKSGPDETFRNHIK
jgi:hypothetical protein